MPTITPFSVLSALPKGAHLEAIEITITKAGKREPFGDNGTKQRSEVVDSEGGRGFVQWTDYDADPDWQRKPPDVPVGPDKLQGWDPMRQREHRRSWY